MNNNLIDVALASDLTGITKTKIYKVVRNDVLRRFGTRKILLNKDEVEEWIKGNMKKANITKSPYENIALDYGESLKFIDGLHNPNMIVKPGKYLTKEQFAVSNFGRVFNLTRNIILSASEAAHGYLQVSFGGVHGTIHERIHVLVASFWCANRKRKEEVHHINGNRKDNRAVNLIFVTAKQHDVADSMLKKARESNDYTEYYKFISDIEKENQWDKEYRGLVFDKELATVFTWIPKEIFDDYHSGKISLDEVSTDNIIGGAVVPRITEANE